MPQPPVSAKLQNSLCRVVNVGYLNENTPKDVFVTIYSKFVSQQHADAAEGPTMALSLLYTRLVQSFIKGKTQVLETGEPTSGGVPAKALTVAPSVAEALQHVSTDLAACHELLPPQYRDWSVVSIAKDALEVWEGDDKKVVYEAAELLYATLHSLSGDEEVKIDEATIVNLVHFLQYALSWMTVRTTKSVEAYGDFLLLWNALDWSHIDTAPGEKQGSPNAPVPPLTVQWQQCAWQMASMLANCHQRAESQLAPRRQRLVASAVAVIITGILAQQASSNKEPPLKKAKTTGSTPEATLSAMVQAVVSAANVEAALVRWGVVKEAFDLNEEEIIRNLKPLYVSMVETANIHASTTTTALPAPFDFCQHANQLAMQLATIVETLYWGSCTTAATDTAVPIEMVLYVNESLLVDFDNVAPFCERAKDKNDEKEDKSSSAKSIKPADTPAVMTEHMELMEWTNSLLHLDMVRVNSKLLEVLQLSSNGQLKTWAQIMMPVLNKVLLPLSQESMTEKTSRQAPVTVAMEPHAGTVVIHNDDSPEKFVYRAVVAFYYHALEAILHCETARTGNAGHPALVLNETFHRAVLACCCTCVVKAAGLTQKLRPNTALGSLQMINMLQVCESSPFDLLKVSETFNTSLMNDAVQPKMGSPVQFHLPRLLQKEMFVSETAVLDATVWSRSLKFQVSLPDVVEEFIEKTNKVHLWPVEALDEQNHMEAMDLAKTAYAPKPTYPTPENEHYQDYATVNYLMGKLSRLAYYRLDRICQILHVPAAMPLISETWVMFRHVLRSRVDLLYDRHVDHILLCCFYGVAKAIQLSRDISFISLIDAYTKIRGNELGEITCQRIVRNVKMDSGDKEEVGDIITFYNKIFVKEMKDFLLDARSIQSTREHLHKITGTTGGVQIYFNVFQSTAQQESGTKPVLSFGQPQVKTS